MEEYLVIAAIALIGYLLYKVYKQKEDTVTLQNNFRQAKLLCDNQKKKIFELKSKCEHLEKSEQELKVKYSYLEQKEHELNTAKEQVEELEQYKTALIKRIEMYISHKCEGYNHLAGLMADMTTRHYEKTAHYLKTKKHPAIKGAQAVEELQKETREIKKENKILEYKLAYIRSLYPNIDDIFDDAFDSFDFELETEETTDRVRLYLDSTEYNKLSPIERNQLALDKYIQGNKTKWQIGRDYELYIGYLCEQHGCKVEYTGISLKLEDMGRDLIVYDQLNTYIIQCKNWSQEKEIHEKHIFQLYGSVVLYRIEHPSLITAKAVFVTTTQLSDKAKQFADALDIDVKYVKMGEFPRIKCNIGKDADGNQVKIYHLPFDQQYDRTQIRNAGEMYATTVEEAENAGFRRAHKWHGTHP